MFLLPTDPKRRVGDNRHLNLRSYIMLPSFILPSNLFGLKFSFIYIFLNYIVSKNFVIKYSDL